MIIIFTDSPNYPNRAAGAYRIATVLRKSGREVEVIDYVSKWSIWELISYLTRIKNIEWVGFSSKFEPPGSARSHHYFSQGKKRDNKDLGKLTRLVMDDETTLLSYIRSRKIKIVVGGPNADLLRNVGADYVSMGYSDIGILKIDNHIRSNTDLIHEKIGNTIVVDCDTNYPVNDLSDLGIEYHESDFIADNEVFPVEISRGCIFHCAFCEFRHLGKKPGTYIRPKEDIKKDILDRFIRYGSKRFILLDDTFNDSVEKMNIIKEIREEIGVEFEFWAYCRLDLLAARPEMVDLIPKIGWKSLTCGVETFNRESGKSVGKGADPIKLQNFLISLRERFPDLRIQINIIVGLPHDTEQSAHETVQWFIDNPNITHFIKVVPLSVRDPKDRLSASKIGKNPGKFGYVFEGTNNGNFIWRTNTMTSEEAYRISTELKTKLKERFSTITDNKDTIALMHDSPVNVIKDGKVINTLMFMVEHYIENKLSYR